MSIFASWLVLTIGFMVAAATVRGFKVNGAVSAFIIAAMFGVLNHLLGWAIFAAIGVATLGVGFVLGFVTRLIVNAIVLKVTDALTDRLTIDGFLPAVIGGGVISLVGVVGDFLTHPVAHAHWR